MIKLDETKEKKLEIERSMRINKELEDCTFIPKIIELDESILKHAGELNKLENQMESFKGSSYKKTHKVTNENNYKKGSPAKSEDTNYQRINKKLIYSEKKCNYKKFDNESLNDFEEPD